MIDLKIVRCKYCKYYIGKEFSVENKYIKSNNNIYDEFVTFSNNKPIKMCQHKNCFETSPGNDPVNGPFVVSKRVRGQSQLNRNNDCIYFKISKIVGIFLWILDSLKLKIKVNRSTLYFI